MRYRDAVVGSLYSTNSGNPTGLEVADFVPRSRYATVSGADNNVSTISISTASTDDVSTVSDLTASTEGNNCAFIGDEQDLEYSLDLTDHSDSVVEGDAFSGGNLRYGDDVLRFCEMDDDNYSFDPIGRGIYEVEMEGGRQSTSFRSGPVLSDYAMDDGVCLIDEFRDGSRQLSGKVAQLETDDRDQA